MALPCWSCSHIVGEMRSGECQSQYVYAIPTVLLARPTLLHETPRRLAMLGGEAIERFWKGGPVIVSLDAF